MAALVTYKLYGFVAGGPARALAQSKLEPIVVEGAAPPVAGKDETGRAHTLRELRGRLVILNLWYTECAPCREEMPSLNKLAQQVGGRGVEVIALSVDTDWGKVKQFFRTNPHLAGKNLAFKVWLDREKVTPPRYGTFKYPETFVISPSGEQLARFIGPRNWASPDAIQLIETLAR